MHSIASICKLGVKTLPLLYPLQTYTTYEPLQSYSSVGISPFSADCLLIAANYLNPSLGFLKAAFFLFLFSFYVLHCARPEHCYRCQPNSVSIHTRKLPGGPAYMHGHLSFTRLAKLQFLDSEMTTHKLLYLEPYENHLNAFISQPSHTSVEVSKQAHTKCKSRT